MERKIRTFLRLLSRLNLEVLCGLRCHVLQSEISIKNSGVVHVTTVSINRAGVTRGVWGTPPIGLFERSSQCPSWKTTRA